MEWAHNTEQCVENLLAVRVRGELGHHINAIQNSLLHKVVCRHKSLDPASNDKMKRQEGGLAYISPTSVVSTWCRARKPNGPSLLGSPNKYNWIWSMRS